MTTTPPRIDPRLGAAALRAPAASMVDSRPQAILKLRPRNSFDYRVRYEPQPNTLIFYTLIFLAFFTTLGKLSANQSKWHQNNVIYKLNNSKCFGLFNN